MTYFGSTTVWSLIDSAPPRPPRPATRQPAPLILTEPPFIIFGSSHHTNWRFLIEFASCYAAPIVAGTWLLKFPA